MGGLGIFFLSYVELFSCFFKFNGLSIMYVGLNTMYINILLHNDISGMSRFNVCRGVVLLI